MMTVAILVFLVSAFPQDCVHTQCWKEARLKHVNTNHKCNYSPRSTMATLSAWTVGLQNCEVSIEALQKHLETPPVAMLGNRYHRQLFWRDCLYRGNKVNTVGTEEIGMHTYDTWRRRHPYFFCVIMCSNSASGHVPSVSHTLTEPQCNCYFSNKGSIKSTVSIVWVCVCASLDVLYM